LFNATLRYAASLEVTDKMREVSSASEYIRNNNTIENP
jgi:hypothetical protein